MFVNSGTVRILPWLVALPLCLFGQATQSGPDVITFVNGDRMSGQLISLTGKGVVFRGAMVGEVTVEWSKIRDLHSDNGFGGITGNPTVATSLPQTVPPAPVAIAAQTPTPVAPPPSPVVQTPPAAARPAVSPATAPVTTTSAPPPAAAPAPSSAAKGRPWFGSLVFSGWQGNAAAGISYVAATQSFINFAPSVNLQRTWPKGNGNWPVRARTYLNFMVNFAKETQNGDVAYFDPVARTVIIPGAFMKTYGMHADFVQDYFLFPRLFLQGGASFDHSYAQSLDLLQSYGGGLGFVVYRTDRSEFDLRGGVGYAKQQYDGYPGLDASVIGSRFYQSYQHRFANGMSFSEQGGMRPAWTDPRYLFGGGSLSFNMPIYHRLNANVSSFEFWSRTPPPMLKKNVFQVAVGLSYAF